MSKLGPLTRTIEIVDTTDPDRPPLSLVTIDLPVPVTIGTATDGATVTIGSIRPALAAALRDAADALDEGDDECSDA